MPRRALSRAARRLPFAQSSLPSRQLPAGRNGSPSTRLYQDRVFRLFSCTTDPEGSVMANSVLAEDRAAVGRTDYATSEITYPLLVGDLYARWVLDTLIEIGYVVARDFTARPEFYKGGEVPAAIVDLRMAYGYTAQFPNRAQRNDIVSPIFGPSDGYVGDAASEKFRALRKPLFDACITFAERTVDQSIEGLRQRILSALELFQPYLENFDGTSIRLGHAQVANVSNVAYDIFRSAGIAQVFGVNPPPSANWPISANDSSGALLIRSIGEKLQLAPEHVVNEEKFQRLRRVAEQGSLALTAILQAKAVNGLDEALVTSIYTWAISLRDYWAA
jgi:hypothetical protein